MQAENYAYVTVVTNEQYLDGCCVLQETLKSVGAEYPFYVLLPANIPLNILQTLKKRRIRYLFADESPYQKISSMDNRRQYWGETIFKLEIFRLVQFKKIVYLDADMIVLNNLDHLFSRPHMSAVIAGKSLHPNWVGLNSGLMVIEPDENDYFGMRACVDDVRKMMNASGNGFGDQNIIKAYYRNWPARADLHLEETYNVMLGYAGALKRNRQIDSIGDIYVYHFTGEQKPWSRHLTDRIIILLKIAKRKGCSIDFRIFHRYIRCLKEIGSGV